MRKPLAAAAACVSLCLVACGPSAAETLTQFEAAVNGKNLDAAMALAHAQIIVSAFGEDRLTGQAQVRSWLESLAAANVQLTPRNAPQAKDATTLTWTAQITSDELRALDVAPLEVNGEAMVQAGKIGSYSLTYTADSQAALEAALESRNKRMAGKLTAALGGDEAGAALAFFADDGKVMLMPDTKYSGKEEIASWLEARAAGRHGAKVLEAPEAQGERVRWTARMDAAAGLGVAALEMRLSATIRQGKIQVLTIGLTEDAQAKLEKSTGQKPTAAAALGSSK